MDQIILTTFTDPMMGLSYECEPVYEQLAARYQELIVFKYVMSGLVRDVSDFMLPEELSLPPVEGIIPTFDHLLNHLDDGQHQNLNFQEDFLEWLFRYHPIVIHDFEPLSHTAFYSYRM